MEEAEDAIAAVHADTSVSKEETKDSLEELIDEIKAYIQAVEDM
jgi:hypothetical protein